MSAGALDGLRVLDLTGPEGAMAGRLLGLLGAEVLKIEPPEGCPSRRRPPLSPTGESLFWAAYGTGRTALTAADPGAEARALAPFADVVLEAGSGPFLPTDALLAANPGLIHAIVTPFGPAGPKAGYAATDLTLWAAGGPLKPTEAQAGIPTRMQLPQAWAHAAADAVCGIMTALVARRRTGRGQQVATNAQASATQSTLSLSLAAATGHPDYVFRAEIRSKKRKQLDLSGSGSRTQRSKWDVADGLVEMHLALGPAAGRFTNNLFKLMHSRGACPAEFAEWDWVTLPPKIENDEIPEEKMEEARELVAAFLAPLTKREAVEMALAHRLMLAPIMTLDDLLDSPHAEARGFWQQVGGRKAPGKPALGFDEAFVTPAPAPAPGEGGADTAARWRAGPAPKRPFAAPAAPEPGDVRPFEGLTVLDLSWVVAGPMIGRCLSDFGARVIRVESAKRPETARVTGPWPGGVRDLNKSGLYENCNAGKLGLTLDLASEDGRALVRDLAGQADVLVESFAPGQMARWGLSYDVLRAKNPGLVMLSTALMGQSGPWSALAGFGNIGAAMSGIQLLAARPGRPPFGPYGPYTDYVAPRLALPVLIAALEARRESGEGRWIDISQAEAGLHFIAEGLLAAQEGGFDDGPQGNRDPQMAPNECYPCAAPAGETAWIAISAQDDAAFARLATATGLAALADPGLATLAGRKAREGEIDAALAAWTATRDAAAVEAQLQAAGVAAHVAASTVDLAADPALEAWGHFLRLPRADGSESVVEACRFRLSDTPARTTRAAPALGQDVDEVLGEVLGLSTDRIATLKAAGVLT